MTRSTITVLRLLLGTVMALLLLGQLVLLPLIAWETARAYPELAGHAVPLGVLVGAGFLGVEIAVWCVWRLARLVRDDAVFGPASFRYVDLMVRAFAGTTAAATVVLGYVLILGQGPITVPLAVLAVAVTAGTVTLLVVVLRALLGTAVRLEADLGEVI